MNNIFDLSGKIALVSAARGDIGRTVARTLSAAGARVAVSNIEPSTGAETFQIINDAGGDAFHAVVVHYGRLDVPHNNARVGART